MDGSITRCAKCRVCQNSGYQAPPALYAGNAFAPVLVVGQNPGEMRDERDIALAECVQNGVDLFDNVDALISAWYNFDFGESKACKAFLSQILGEGWLKTGTYAFTNAIRCRTQDNHAPSEEMLYQCMRWTKPLLYGKKVIITMGNMATTQISEILKHNESISVLSRLTIPHYSVWKRSGVNPLAIRRQIIKTLEEHDIKF